MGPVVERSLTSRGPSGERDPLRNLANLPIRRLPSIHHHCRNVRHQPIGAKPFCLCNTAEMAAITL
jgi:hypothetical protein